MTANFAFPFRRIIVMVVMAAGVSALLWKAIDLQLNHAAFLKTQGDARHLRVVKIQSTRGRILDRNNEPLAISTPVNSVCANPKELALDRDRWPELAHLLGIDEDKLQRLIAKRIGKEFIYLKRRINPELSKQVKALKLSGVYLKREYKRFYPTGEVAAHAVGFTNVDDEGQEGLELAYDDWLQGQDGRKRVLIDRYGQVVEDVEMIESARDGADLFISIDKRIQYIAYRALKAAVKQHDALGGSVVVMDVRTGEVLAMANQPAYNPNNGAERVGDRFRNRAVTDVFEPGSTVKPFTVASALETGKFRPHSLIDTNPGFMRIGGNKVTDIKNFGIIDVATVLKKSSNVAASKMALALDAEHLWDTFQSVGFGKATGSGFPGESAGILTDYYGWSEFERATLSFGYGLSVTPLQLAHAYAVVANGGLMVPVTLVKTDFSEEPRRVMPAYAALQVRKMLEGVTHVGGTATRASIVGYRVAGKTGTTRKSAAGGYSQNRYLAVFAGIVPASAPRLVGVVTIDEPKAGDYYGGQVAAPVFAEVLAGALRLQGIAPDSPYAERTTLVTKDVALPFINEVAVQ